MDNRWVIYIDIEGFSALYPVGNEALWALNRMALAIHRIGKIVFPEPPDRLFAYQLGDGFIIVSDFHESNLDRPVLLATLLMKYMANFGVFASAAITEGGLSGITGFYPEEVINDCIEGNPCIVSMGTGLMTLFPVMGTSLINAVAINKKAPKGPLFVIPIEFADRLSSPFGIMQITGEEFVAIDWVHAKSHSMTEIANKVQLDLPQPKEIETMLKRYISTQNLPAEWEINCVKFLKLSHSV